MNHIYAVIEASKQGGAYTASKNFATRLDGTVGAGVCRSVPGLLCGPHEPHGLARHGVRQQPVVETPVA